MPITPLPTPPQPTDTTAQFNTKAFAFVAALAQFVTEANVQATEVDADAVLAQLGKTEALAAAAAAAAVAGATRWTSGTTYAQGAAVWSPITFLTYRRRTAGASTTDPSADSTNWAQVAGLGDVSQAGVQTLTNKTLANPSVTGNLVLAGTGNRIQGDFSNVTPSSRAMLQTSTVNANTSIHAVPNGSGVQATIEANNAADAGNSAGIRIQASATEVRLESVARGTAAALPLSIYAGGIERARIGTDGSQSSVVPGSSILYLELKCRAWVNFNGTGTVAIRASGNVSSITDLGIGNYRVNLANAMPDTSYAVCATSSYSDSAAGRICNQDNRLGAKTTSQVFIATDNGGAYADSDQIGVFIFR